MSSNAALDFAEVVKTHAIRILEWMLVKVQPLPYEAQKLSEAGVTSTTLLSYSVWRRTMLMVALPSLYYSALASLIGLKDEDYTGFNGLGKIVLFLPRIAGVVIAVGSSGALWYWTTHTLSNRWVLAGWMGSLALPFLPALFPLKWIVTSRIAKDLESDAEYNATLTTLFAFAYVSVLIPIVVSIPLGMLRAALRIRGLLPDNTLAGWIMMVTIPLNTMIVLMGLVLASQFVGNVILIVAMIFFIVGPLVYLYNRTIYTEPITAEVEPQLHQRQMIVRLTNLVGLLFLLIWVFSAEWNGRDVTGSRVTESDDDYYDSSSELPPHWTYGEVIQMWFEFIGRTLVATLGFADIFLRAALASWKTEVQQREKMLHDAHDGEYTAVEKELMLGKKDVPAGTGAAAVPPKDLETPEPTETYHTGPPLESGEEITEETYQQAYGAQPYGTPGAAAYTNPVYGGGYPPATNQTASPYPTNAHQPYAAPQSAPYQPAAPNAAPYQPAAYAGGNGGSVHSHTSSSRPVAPPTSSVPYASATLAPPRRSPSKKEVATATVQPTVDVDIDLSERKPVVVAAKRFLRPVVAAKEVSSKTSTQSGPVDTDVDLSRPLRTPVVAKAATDVDVDLSQPRRAPVVVAKAPRPVVAKAPRPVVAKAPLPVAAKEVNSKPTPVSRPLAKMSKDGPRDPSLIGAPHSMGGHTTDERGVDP